MDNKLFSKNFSLLLAGQTISLFGNCILDFALSMYVLEITGSAAIFAGFLAIAMLPTILLSPLGGVLADRANRRNIMVTLDFLAGIVVLIAVVMIDRGNNLVIIGATLVIQSILGAFEMPTVQACVPQMQSGDNIIRGNALVNQISAISALIAPFIGSVLYTSFGLKPVMYAGVACFFATAAFECFIKLEYKRPQKKENIWNIIKNDLADSTHFISREKPYILKILLLVTVIAFFIQGVALVGFPYIVRTILGLSANYYGAAVSILSFASIIGSIAAGLLAAKFRIGRLSITLFSIGFFLLPVGLIFFIPAGAYIRYATLILAFFAIQIAACIFSVFALSIIQQLTPENMTGKVMAFAATFSLCAQPLGQIIYGMLFDKFSNVIYVILIPTGIILCMISFSTKRFFGKLEEQLDNNF
ncbi:MFS transporter [Konateibacter massiliensis]|uniref:MFS transporter n=1 Tax=Konateibacter massiliensis TaxID=2002841 RepID=UPI000C15B82C|nr:MFS transporter [Konateibacter massiliensis]